MSRHTMPPNPDEFPGSETPGAPLPSGSEAPRPAIDSAGFEDDTPPQLRELVESHVSAWETGTEPNAIGVLAEHPELLGFPILAAELAYAEYAVRLVQGTAPTPHVFCEGVPSFCRDYVWQMLNIHGSLLDENSSWLAVMRRQMAVATAPWPKTGTEWLGYQLHEELGRGGLARVYLASELSVGGRQVVLKITPYETAEGHVQSNLIHDSLMPVLTVRRDESTGLTAIVMPFWGRATLMDVRDEIAQLEADHLATAKPPPDSVWDSLLKSAPPPSAHTVPAARHSEPVVAATDTAPPNVTTEPVHGTESPKSESGGREADGAERLSDALEAEWDVDLQWLVRERAMPISAALTIPPDIVQRVAKDRCGDSRPNVPRDEIRGAAPATFEQAVARLGIQLSEALAVMHGLGILHRDLKPTNVLLSPAGRPILLDFNLSAAIERGDVLLGGTIPYMPPEYLEALVVDLQGSDAAFLAEGVVAPSTSPPTRDPDNAPDGSPETTDTGRAIAEDTPSLRTTWVRRVRFGGRLAVEDRPTVRGFRPRSSFTGNVVGADQDASHKVAANGETTSARTAGDPRSDIYSLGVILYELLCGRLPYREPSQQWPLRQQAEWMLLQQAERIPTACKELRRFSPEWRTILRRCLAFEAEERFADARQLQEALRALAPADCESPEPATGRRRRTLSGFLAFASALIVLALVLYGIPRAPLARGPANIEQVADAPTPNNSALERPILFPSRWDLDTRPEKSSTYDRATRDMLRRIDRVMLPLRNVIVTKQQLKDARQELERLLPNSGSCAADVHGCLGYCDARLQDHALAVGQITAALGERNALRYTDVGRLHNTLAYSLMQVGRLDMARQHANQALTLPGDAAHFAATHHNRAFLTMRLVERDARRVESGRERLTDFDYRDVVNDLELARQFGSSSVKFHFDAAAIYANAAMRLNRLDYRDQAARDLAESLRQGLDRRVLHTLGPVLGEVAAQYPEIAAHVPSRDNKKKPSKPNPADREQLELPSTLPAQIKFPPTTPRLQKPREPLPPIPPRETQPPPISGAPNVRDS